MKAEDTVMKTNPFNSNAEEQAERLCWAAYEDGKNEHAEVFFKVGIKEVVDWIEGHKTVGAYTHRWSDDFEYLTVELVEFDESEWQAKLKEWGINP